MGFIGAHQGNRVGADGLVWGVDSMCQVLTEHGMAIAPSTYYEYRRRSPSARMRADARVIDAIFHHAPAAPADPRPGLTQDMDHIAQQWN
ncbi:hypothetical protein ACFOJ6_25670 [Gordonia humi]|uniref:hypothetical protein n=1 Tax=Gordonia humi TaxID=686429 RepID=UPI00360EFFA9